jgi:hypothetical protein
MKGVVDGKKNEGEKKLAKEERERKQKTVHFTILCPFQYSQPVVGYPSNSQPLAWSPGSIITPSGTYTSHKHIETSRENKLGKAGERKKWETGRVVGGCSQRA